MVTFGQGVKVYRAGWRESCRNEVEREMERMYTEQNKVVEGYRKPEGVIEMRERRGREGIVEFGERREREGVVELGDMSLA